MEDKKQADVSIIKQIVNGEVEIHSVEEFEKIINTFPDSPELNTAFADFLSLQNDDLFTCHEYCRSSQLFLKTGRPIQAIGAKFHAWKIINPDNDEYRCFFDSLVTGLGASNTLGNYLEKISFSEMDQLVQNVELLSVPQGKTILHAGDEEDALYCVLSGELEIIPVGKKVGHKFTANKIFGPAYPLEEMKTASYSVISLTKTKLLKIPKTYLNTICAKYPNMEKVLKRLYEQADKISREAQKAMRKASRQQITTQMNIEIFPDTVGRSPVQYVAYSGDISLGGMCIFLDPKKHREFPVTDTIGHTARVLINLPDETISLRILGKIAWCKLALIDGEKTGAIGIQFDEMPPSLRGLLVIFANAIGAASFEKKV